MSYLFFSKFNKFIIYIWTKTFKEYDLLLIKVVQIYRIKTETGRAVIFTP